MKSLEPQISVIVPVYNVEPKWLNLCVNSVLNQIYDNWELCLYDDGSTNIETVHTLRKWKKRDKRIKINFRKTNKGISAALNECIKMASGKYIALLDNMDELTNDALLEVAKRINSNPDLKFIYSDEDIVERNGFLAEPYYKPDFNLDLFLSNNYISHLTIIKKSLGDKVGWFRKDYEGAQDYDFFLRCIENINVKNVFHIPKILYHYQEKKAAAENIVEHLPSVSSSLNPPYPPFAKGGGKKPIDSPRNDFNQLQKNELAAIEHLKKKIIKSSIKALEDYLKRNGIDGQVLEGKFLGTFRIKRKILKEELVSIIIPFKDRVELLEKCVDSLLNKTDYKNFEILLINNRSREKKILQYLDRIVSNDKRIIRYDYNHPFNFSAMNNWAVKRSKGKYILFLNNDTEVISREWLSAMVEHIQRKEVGAVGAKLLYKDNTIQHAGITIDSGRRADHIFRHLNGDDSGYFGQLNLIRDCSGCTAACLLIKRSLFEKINGFDEKYLKMAFNDVDLCLKIRDSNHLIVYTPYAELYHYESASRGYDDTPKKIKLNKKEFKFLKNKWKDKSLKDTYFNPNLMISASNLKINSEGMKRFLKDKNQTQFVIPMNMSGIRHNTGDTIGNLHFCFTAKHEKGHCVYGPGLRVENKSLLKATFFIEFINIFEKDEYLIKLDVYDSKADNILVFKSISFRDLKSMEEQFTLEFKETKSQILEFRIYWNKNCDIAVSKIILEKMK